MQTKKECYLTHSVINLDRHHIMNGPSRRKAEEDGLWVWLNHDVHMYVHEDARLRLRLKADGQRAWEKRLTDAGLSPAGARDAWMHRYHKNYL